MGQMIDWHLIVYILGVIGTLLGVVASACAFFVFRFFSRRRVLQNAAAQRTESIEEKEKRLNEEVAQSFRDLYDSTKEKLAWISKENDSLREQVGELMETNRMLIDLNLKLQENNRQWQDAFTILKPRLKASGIAYDDVALPH